MEYVEAIKELEQISLIKDYLKRYSERDYVLFVFGINTGLKITEILAIQVKDVMENEKIKEFYILVHKDEKIEIYMNTKVKEVLVHYIESRHLQEEDYLFASSKTKKPITRQQAYRILHQAAKAIGIQGKIGTNSMRKTFGYHAYKQGVAISLLQKYLHHSTPSETLKYLGILKEEKLKTEIDVNL